MRREPARRTGVPGWGWAVRARRLAAARRSGAFHNLTHLNAFDGCYAVLLPRDLVSHRPGSFLRFEQQHRCAAVLGDSHPVCGDEARRLGDTRYDLVPKELPSPLEVMQRRSGYY